MSLSDPLKLRSTADLGETVNPRPVQTGYGQVKAECIAYDDTGRAWLWLDGNCGGVDQVWIDGAQSVGGWAAAVETDDSGAPAVIVRTSQPAQQVVASGRGRISETTGGVAENPADIIDDLYRFAGLTPPPGLSQFRAESAARNIRLGGLVDSERTLRAWIEDICLSSGVIWSPFMVSFARFLWDRDPTTGQVTTDDQAAVYSVGPLDRAAARFNRDEIATVVRLRFALDHSTGEYGKAMTLKAPQQIQSHGEVVLETDADWIVENAVAEAVGRSILAWRVPVWEITASKTDPLEVGDWIGLANPLLPLTSGTALIRAIREDLETGEVGIEARARAAAVGPIQVTLT